MFLKLAATLAALVPGLMSSGCRGTDAVVEGRQNGEGTSVLYPITLDQAWEISRAVLKWEGAEAIEEHRDKGYMLTSFGMNLVSWGTVAGAWVEPGEQPQTKVTVISKRKMPMNLFTVMTEGTFHSRFAQGVEIVKSGKPLPGKVPD